MAVDLKFEAFSNEFFESTWEILYGVQVFCKPRPISGLSQLPISSEITNEILYAVTIRVDLFQCHQLKFDRDYYRFSKSGVDFYIYIKDYCEKLSNNLNIFDKFLLVYSVALIMGRICLSSGNDIYIDIAPLCCAMYIDEHLKDEFYEAGGWNELKRHACTYKNILKDVKLGNSDVQNAFKAFHAASTNYNIGLLQDCFQKRWKIINECGQDMDLCSKCSLLSSAFVFLLKNESSETDKTVECLLQLTLCIQSLEEQTVDISNVSEELGKLSVHSKNSDRSISDLKKVRDQESDSLSSSGDFKETSTLNLFQKMFGDPDGIKSEVDLDSPDSSSKDLCPLCFRQAINPLESGKKKQFENEKQVRLRIMEEINLCNLEVSSKHFKYKDINPEDTSRDEERTRRKKRHSMHLRYFIALGTEPAKSRIQSEFSSSSDEQSNIQTVPNTSSDVQSNIQTVPNTSSDVQSNIQTVPNTSSDVQGNIQTVPKTSSKRKKRSRRRKKNTKPADN